MLPLEHIELILYTVFVCLKVFVVLFALRKLAFFLGDGGVQRLHDFPAVLHFRLDGLVHLDFLFGLDLVVLNDVLPLELLQSF